MAAGTRAVNDSAIEYQRLSPLYVCTASVPLLVIDDAVAEIERVAGFGFTAVFFPIGPPPVRNDWNHAEREPVWSALEATKLVLGFQIGNEPHDDSTNHGAYFRGAGGALTNYVETTYGGQRAVTKMIASGAFERHPDLKVIVSEGGATWGPFLADRLDDADRQHGSAMRPALRRLPSESLRERLCIGCEGDDGDGMAERRVGQRLSAHRGDLRAHAEDIARTVRRHLRV